MKCGWIDVTDHNAFLFAPFAEIHKRVLAYEVGL
jgi:hypothetical protein